MMLASLPISIATLALAGPAASLQTALPGAARVDAYTDKPRLLVLTDIANEPDDQMSLVRLLIYSNELEIEGLVATTSTWLREGTRPDVILKVLDAYAQVRPRLLQHADGYPDAESLRQRVRSGQPGYGMAAVGQDRLSPGAEWILGTADRDDPRPLWVSVWGGANTLAQALLHARETRSAAELRALLSKLRVYSISDQDDAGPWLRREFESLHYVVSPSPPDGSQYREATWTGISGDRFYKNAPGADFSTFEEAWLDAHIRAKGPLGAHYPDPCCIHEGDTPSFLGLLGNGLASHMSPAFGGWGGRYVWRQTYGESRPCWTQGGDSYPGNASSRDTIRGTDGRSYTSDQATVWRWRRAFQHDFAARMDWTVSSRESANHNPLLVVNGEHGRAPVQIAARVGEALVLDAAGSRDPDGDGLSYEWLFYPEAGTGIPGQPVYAAGRPAYEPRPGSRGFPELVPRVALAGARTRRATLTPRIAGIAHVILVVEDDGSPSLTSYRRVILKIAP
jgi:hypothetical protein